MTTARVVHELFSTLWHEREQLSVVERITEAVTSQEDTYGLEAVLVAFGGAESKDTSSFREWNHRQEMLSNDIQTAFKEYWNTAEGFVKWLEDASITDEHKQELLQIAVTEHTQEWMALLRNAVKSEDALDVAAGYLPVPVLRQGVAKLNFYQASVLSRTMDCLERHVDVSLFLTASGMSLSSSLSKALLRYMQDADTLKRTLTEEEIIGKFLACLYLIIYKGERGKGYQEDADWKRLAGMLMPEPEQREVDELAKQKAVEIMSGRKSSKAELQVTIQSLVERHPEKLLDWLEKEAGIEEIHRIAEVVNATIFEQWMAYLPTVTGFVNADAFRRLVMWLLRFPSGRYSVTRLATVLFGWINTAEWKRQTSRQMEEYFFARLYNSSDKNIPLPLENLAQTDLSEALRKWLLQYYLRFRPKELAYYIRHSVEERLLPLAQWTEWLYADEWLKLFSRLSLSMTELLRQVAEVLHLDEQAQRQAWASF